MYVAEIQQTQATSNCQAYLSMEQDQKCPNLLKSLKDHHKDPVPNFKGSPSMLMLASIYAAAVPCFGSPFPNCRVLYFLSMYRTRSKHC